MKRRAAGCLPRNKACLNQGRIDRYSALPRTSEAWVQLLVAYISLGNPFFPFHSDLLWLQESNKTQYNDVIETENAKKVKRFFRVNIQMSTTTNCEKSLDLCGVIAV